MRAVIADIPKRWLEEHRASDVAQWDEMWNGELHMAAMPTRKHQDLGFHLQMYLFNHWQLSGDGRVNQEVNLTTPGDEAHWTTNYRIPDLVLLDPSRFHIDKGDYMVGAPLVVVEIRSPNDESYAKLDFYSDLGVPEVWIIERDTKEPEIFTLVDGGYELGLPDPDGWMTSKAIPAAMKATGTGKLRIQMRNDRATLAELPDR